MFEIIYCFIRSDGFKSFCISYLVKLTRHYKSVDRLTTYMIIPAKSLNTFSILSHHFTIYNGYHHVAQELLFDNFISKKGKIFSNYDCTLQSRLGFVFYF